MAMNVSASAALAAGLQAHRGNRLAQAIAAYGAVLAAVPDHPTARHLRGFALLQQDRLEEAAEDLRVAVRADPGNAAAWSHLSVCLERLSQAPIDAARRAILLAPATAEALDVLSRDRSEGVRAVNRLLIIGPGDPAAWERAGQARAHHDVADAIRCLRRAQCLAPQDPAPRLDLADLTRRDRKPNHAMRLASRSLILRPNDPRGLAERAAAATELDAIDAARTDTARALALDPGHAKAWGNRAEAFYRLADYPAARAAGQRALAQSPHDPGIRANLGAYRLAAGDLSGGWPLFRSRPARRSTAGPALPRWRGETGARLLVLAEQGLGDELLFSTLWRDLDDRVADGRLASATVEADARLHRLATRALPHLGWRRRLHDAGSDIAATHWCLAGDLAEILRPTLADFPGPGPGLAADPRKVSGWRDWLASAADGRPSIGLCWRSGSRAGHRRRHYPSLAECAPLLHRERCFFVVLQYDDCEDEVARAAVGPGSDLAIPPGLDRRDDQDGVAALVQAVDVLVSADTAVLALAGALGRPAIGIALHPGWVGLGQPDHPWFPGVERIYRPVGQTWERTMVAVAARIDRVLAAGE